VASFGDLIGRMLGRREEPPDRLELPPVPTATELLAELDRVEEMVADAAVPTPVESRVRRVTRVVRDAIPRLDRMGGGSEQAYLVMATATDYLPDAVSAYLRLPRDWANSRPVDGGRTSLMVLIDQLDLLARTMDKVLDAVNRSDAAALVAHGRFLAERFGARSSGGQLRLDDAGGPPEAGRPAGPPDPVTPPDGPERLRPPDGGRS
jgi:hypothetical protein